MAAHHQMMRKMVRGSFSADAEGISFNTQVRGTLGQVLASRFSKGKQLGFASIVGVYRRIDWFLFSLECSCKRSL
jgi:hypothetical protein